MDLKRVLGERFGVDLSEVRLGSVLKELGFSHISARPRHPAQDAQAIAAFYAYESQVPEIAAQKIAGLRRFYGITEPQALAYFAVHEVADVRHRAAWREWLASQKDLDTVGALCAAERSLKALWGALDAVYPQGRAQN